MTRTRALVRRAFGTSTRRHGRVGCAGRAFGTSARRSARRSGCVAVLALGLLVAFPAALADHAYSHQYRVFGRVVDADGAPVSGALVFLEFRKNAENWRMSLTTDCLGDYGYGMMDHFHVHELSTVAEIHAAVFDPADPANPLDESTFAADRNLRKSRLDWRLDDTGSLEPCADGAARLASTAFVYGRLWNATGEQKLEGPTVWGDIPGGCRAVNRTAPCQPVEVVVTTPAGGRANATAWSNPYGDFFAHLDLGAPFERATASASWLGRTRTVDVDPVLHTAEADLLSGAPTPARNAPGPGVVSILVLVSLALVLRRR